MLTRISVGELMRRCGEAALQTGPFGTQLKADEYVEEGVPVINVRNVGFGDVRDDDLEFVTEAKAEHLHHHRLVRDDIVFGRKGAVERHGLITDAQEGWVQGSDCLRLRLRSARVDVRYLSYYLRTKAATDAIKFTVDKAKLTEPTAKQVAVGTMERPSWLPTGHFTWPTWGTITSRFGSRYIFGSYSYHSGIDISVPYGSSIKAADGGTVIFAGTGSGSTWSYGKYVVIDHGNGRQTYYAHNSSLLVSVGDKVYQGQVIARAGSTGRSTGPHCHFQVKINGSDVNPLKYLP